jgi:hypothetical protein
MKDSRDIIVGRRRFSVDRKPDLGSLPNRVRHLWVVRETNRHGHILNQWACKRRRDAVALQTLLAFWASNYSLWGTPL